MIVSARMDEDERSFSSFDITLSSDSSFSADVTLESLLDCSLDVSLSDEMSDLGCSTDLSVLTPHAMGSMFPQENTF